MSDPQPPMHPDSDETREAGVASTAPAESADSDSAKPAGVHDVLMLGWEFPPFISGGLGTACYGLTKAMSRRGDHVLFVMPGPTRMGFSASVDTTRAGGGDSDITPLMSMPEFENVDFAGVNVNLTDPYARPQWIPPTMRRRPVDVPEVHDLPAETQAYAHKVVNLALTQRQEGRRVDVVHAHDWMTFAAGRAAADVLGVPLVVHVHSTEFDRAGPDADEGIMEAERHGLHAADSIIAVSEFTASQIAIRYDVPRERITVVHNAVEPSASVAPERPVQIGAAESVVLFLGRMTQQKGPEFFVRAAAKVLQVEPATRFVMAGSGEQFGAMQRLAHNLGIDQHFLFTGFLRGDDVGAMFNAASVFVMPSVSEPFGIVSLEAMTREVPVIVSKQSGAAEVLQHALKVDFWDVDEMANKIVGVLRDPALADQLAQRGSLEVRQMRWEDAAEAVARVYDGLLNGTAQGRYGPSSSTA